MQKITVSAPGKLHLLGEHVVVYGKPAILAAVNRRITATLTKTKGKQIHISSFILPTFSNVIPANPDLIGRTAGIHEDRFRVKPGMTKGESEMTISDSLHISLTSDIILDRTQHARKIWQEFQKNGNILELKKLTVDPLNFVIYIIGETFLYYNKKPANSFSLEITSTLPMGSGMGSSASVAVAVVGVISRLLGKPLDKKIINEIAYTAEKLMHGNPSGGDTSTCTYGGLIWYRKETQDVKIIQPLPFSLSKNLSEKFVIIFTGKPEESTGEMVTKVKSFKSKFKSKVNKIFDAQEILTRELIDAFKNEDIKEVKRIIVDGEKNLEILRVVSSSTKEIIRSIEQSGGAAKICGAGGYKKASGIVLAFHENRKILENLLQSKSLTFSEVKLGEEGVREE